MKKLCFILCLVMALSCSCGNNAESNPSGEVEVAEQSEETRSLPDSITIAMVGDIMMGTDYPSVQLPANDGKDLFKDCKPYFAQADVVAGNLEGIIGSTKACRKDVRKKMAFAFRMPDRFASNLQDAGFDFVSLANNHINDFFPVGIDQTKANLEKIGVAYAGLQSCRYALKEKGGVRYGFCSFGHESYTLCNYDDATIKDVLKELRPQCDILIVCFHGGAEGEGMGHTPDATEYFCGENRGHLRHFAHLCVDNGADIVFGSGPHVTRGLELYKDHLVAYSLGNFCAPYGLGSGGLKGYAPVLVATIGPDGRFLTGCIHSMLQVRGVGPRNDSSHRVSKHMMSLSRADFKNVPQLKEL